VRVLLRNRSFQLLLFGQTLSTLGDRALIIAFGIWVKELTGSDAAAGGAFFFVVFPYLFAPFAGVLIDRFSKRRIFIIANLVMAGILFLTLLVREGDQVWVLYAIILCYGISGVIITSTQAALIPSIVDDNDLPDANGLLQTSGDGVKLLAPLIGAALFTVLGGHVVALLDAATFVAAALCMWRVRAPRDKQGFKGTSTLRDEMLAGLRHVFGTPELRAAVTTLGIALLVTGFSQTLIFAIVDDGLHRPPAFIGVLSSMQGAGAIAAGVTAGVVTRRIGDVRLLTMGIAGIAVSSVIYLVPNEFTAAFGALLFGGGICWTTVGLITAVQRRTPAELRGRALTAATGIVTLPQTLSIAIGAGLSLLVDYRVMLLTIAVVTAGCAIWLGLSRASRFSNSVGS
jgi:MFS family permease